MRSSTLSTTALLSGLALAQNATNGTCVNQAMLDRGSTGSINATGSEYFTWNSSAARDQNITDPWIVSVTVNDTLRGAERATFPNNGGTIGWPYLSVQKSARNVSVCAYQFKSQNTTSIGNIGENDVGCAGYQDLTNDTCTYPSLSGVDIPDDYVTQNMLSSLSPFEAGPGSRWDNYSDMAYDLLVVQPVPFALVGTFESDVNGEPRSVVARDVQFVCVTPNNTQSGSWFPENKTPWENAGVSWHTGGTWSVVAASMLGLVFAL